MAAAPEKEKDLFGEESEPGNGKKRLF